LRSRRLTVLGALGALSLAVTACGGDGGGGSSDKAAGGSGGDTLNLYSSLPLQGANRVQNEAVVNGIKLALKQNNNKAGNFTIKYTSLDDSTAQAGNWDPGATSANARKVAQDEKAIAYIGEFNSGASAISIPILNEAQIAQVSPANTAVGLTSDEPGAEPGEPDKYYPTGKRHYARIVPKDTIQGAALATLMKEEGCQQVGILNDKEVYGAGLSRNIQTAAKGVGLTITGNDAIDKNASNYRSLAQGLEGDCFVYSGVTANNGVQVIKDVAAAHPDAKLFGPDGVAESAFSDPKAGGVPTDVAKRTLVTVATLSPDEYPPEGRKFFQEFEKEYGERNPDPYAIYGYEAASLILDAIKRAGEKGNDKAAVIEALFSTKGRQSVLGTYDIDENGDTTLTAYGVYKIQDGELTFDRTIEAEAAA
jgi:branched-chain amino acid transport system substrate-binding protein